MRCEQHNAQAKAPPNVATAPLHVCACDRSDRVGAEGRHSLAVVCAEEAYIACSAHWLLEKQKSKEFGKGAKGVETDVSMSSLYVREITSSPLWLYTNSALIILPC
jgi:hypothetical protein